MEHDIALAYLRRIGAPPPSGPTAELLRDLHRRHLLTVPFENLSIHLEEPIELTEEALVDKIVRRRRGGFCYELNGAFAGLLTTLGFPVILLAARVFGADRRLGPLFDHLALVVEAGERWLVDVGFGRHTVYPLRLGWPDPQADPGGEFLVVDAPDGDVDVLRDGEPQYRVELRPRSLADFRPTCWWQQTSPASHFTRSLTCSLATPGGRITLSGNRLITTVGKARTETVLPDGAILDTYRTVFGVVLDRAPVLNDRDTIARGVVHPSST